VSDESTTVLQDFLERAITGDVAARQRLLELTRDRLMRHARRFLHGPYARLEPFAETDDLVQQLYLKILQHQDGFWVNARGKPVRTLAEFFGHTSAWMRDVLCDQLRTAYGRDNNHPAVLPLNVGPADTGPRYEPSSSTLDGEKLRRWTEFHEAAARLPDELRAVFDLLWYQGLPQAEAAALLGVAVPTVKVRWMKARLRCSRPWAAHPSTSRARRIDRRQPAPSGTETPGGLPCRSTTKRSGGWSGGRRRGPPTSHGRPWTSCRPSCARALAKGCNCCATSCGCRGP
jgi:RNA polymerase sigma-70 factor (ECF subfamily)